MADDKPKTIQAKTKVGMTCINCQRPIDIGETVTTPDNDEMNRGNVVCADCTSQPDPRAARLKMVVEPKVVPAAFAAPKAESKK